MESNRLEAFSENNVWSETDEKWNYNETPVDIADWRVVGSRVYKSTKYRLEKKDKETLPVGDDFNINNIDIVILNEKTSEKENKAEHYCFQNEGTDVNDTNSSIFHSIDFTDSKNMQYKFNKTLARNSKKALGLNVKDIKKYIDNKHTTFEPSQLIGYTLFIIEFESKRLDIGFTTENINAGVYVILEADRGEDCGKIKFQTDLEKYMSLLETYSLNDEIVPKKILRAATNEDLKVLVRKKELESEALKYCMTRNYLDMEVVSCEYQWDMKKLTFFFVSDDRVDFRELVKDLYKTYKTRIWMCCVEKSKNWCLKTLMYGQV